MLVDFCILLKHFPCIIQWISITNFDCVDYNKLWKILKEMGILDHFTCLLQNLYQVKKQQLELDVEQ